ncbi:TetR family transcriptional regulator [Nocardiopsis akebiae]|uniref:TetR family transcriptional regulator n=1 Tax=Nocardiopsis akebiae TaxID=2831968 RepID=A0ABX8BYG1_9ACTN|nr:TetR/AcrR family transcriptional regulator [Nocardiopsis akebiae]QUX27131.1 TetR family transcriptional regulator [Nocardiopsis akebiae]
MDQRTRRRRRNRAAIQEVALRLFERQGYEATTVAQIAREAGVSHMTFFRCFPSKEDVVLRDEYDPMLEELVREQPDTLPAVERIHRATLVGLGRVYEDSREVLLARARLLLSIPALRSRIGENLASASTAFERGLAPARSEAPDPIPSGSGAPDPATPGTEPPGLETRAVAAACSAVLSEAVVAWVDSHGRDELPALVDRAFLALRAPSTTRHRP